MPSYFAEPAHRTIPFSSINFAKQELHKKRQSTNFPGRTTQKLGFVESYSVEFSEVGKEQADGCGFPSELSSDGHYSFWSAKYCCENLLKMADLDTTGSTIERNLQKKHGRLDNRAQEIEIQDSE